MGIYQYIKMKQNIPKELVLNEIFSEGDGHNYEIAVNRMYEKEYHEEDNSYDFEEIKFVQGGRNTPEHEAGITDSDLLYILIDRAKFFYEQYGDVDDSLKRIELLKEALHLTELRTLRRKEEGTLGNNGEDYNCETVPE